MLDGTVNDGSAPARAGAAWLPVALLGAASACAAAPWLAAWSALAFAAWLGVSAAAAAALWLCRRAAAKNTNPGATPPVEASAAAGADGLRPLLSDVLPVWLHHVGTVKQQTEEAVTQLVISFASITKQFEAAGFVGVNAGEVQGVGTTMSLLTLCERQLRPVITSMSRILDSKAALISSVHDLAGATKELQSMAHDISLIAAQTNILAINAAIEAAHAGDAGRGFAVIAKEIRSLSDRSDETGKRILERMAQIGSIMLTTVGAAEQSSEHDKVAIELSGSVVQDVLTHVRELGSHAETMRAQGNVIRTDADNLLVNLQFQDRVSQILTVIDRDIRRLQRSVAEHEAPLPNAEEWLTELQRQYTMEDQRRALAAAGPAEAAAAAEGEDLVYF
jgi:methyl-accepting chemotaxis protein